MILHLLFDDIFGEYAILQFSGREWFSEFVVINNSLKFIHISENIRVIKPGSEEFEQLKSNIGKYDAVVFHGLFYPWQESLMRVIPDHVKVAWVFWGGEIYGRKDLTRQFLTPLSKAILDIHSLKKKIQNRNTSCGYEFPFDLFRRIDYCLTDVPEDYSFVRSYFRSSIKELWYNYYSVEETIGELSSSFVEGSNILVGNSCTIECNHLDGFRRISSLSLSDSQIIVPLSYGDPWLRNLLLKEGRRRFGSRFYPLIEFLPRSEYNALIKSCAVAIMPHYRPQAFGNILTALWLGTRVYLSEKNMLFSFFKRIGTVVFSIENDLKKSNQSVLLPLSMEETLQNRAVISSVYSKEVMREKNLELVNILNQ